MVRCFEDPNVVHVEGKVHPIEDKEVIDTELQLKDLETVENRIAKNLKVAKTGNKDAQKSLAVYTKIKEHLESGKNVRILELSEDEQLIAKDLFLLTQKPVLYIANVDEDSVKNGNHFVDEFKKDIEEEGARVLMICASLESQIAELSDEEERKLFYEEYGLSESGLDRLIRSAYQLLSLITYFTAGKQEVRAWTIKSGWKAPQAASVIHTDFERGFIKAEVIKLDDYKNFKSETGCRDAGKVAVEGKEYIVQDGDIMHFKFNV